MTILHPLSSLSLSVSSTRCCPSPAWAEIATASSGQVLWKKFRDDPWKSARERGGGCEALSCPRYCGRACPPACALSRSPGLRSPPRVWCCWWFGSQRCKRATSPGASRGCSQARGILCPVRGWPLPGGHRRRLCLVPWLVCALVDKRPVWEQPAFVRRDPGTRARLRGSEQHLTRLRWELLRARRALGERPQCELPVWCVAAPCCLLSVSAEQLLLSHQGACCSGTKRCPGQPLAAPASLA